MERVIAISVGGSGTAAATCHLVPPEESQGS
jgi:hypothetical protein